MKRYIAFILAFSSLVSVSQTNDTIVEKQSFFESRFFENFLIRQSFQGKSEFEKAAFFNIVNPTGSENSLNYSIALGYSFGNWNTTPFVEAQKNTLSTKLQDVFLGGVQLERSPFENQNWGWAPFMIFKANYKNDYEKDTESLQGSFAIAPSFDGNCILLPDSPIKEKYTKYIDFVYNLYLGIEYENRYKTPTDLNEGTTARYVFRITSTFYPFADYLDKSVEIIPDYTYRNSFINESNLEVDENKIFMLDVNLVLFKKKINATKKVEFKFGINYTNGSDPTKGFDKQEITTYSFKLKI